MRTLSRPWMRFYRDELPAPERLDALAADGIRLAIHRVPPPRGEGPAVILCHGLSTNHLGLHLPGRSLAAWLAAHGYDVYLPDLRGSGLSDVPKEGWDLDDHVFRDVPAILEAVRRKSGRDRVQWVGHSMGGLILFCYGIAHPDAPIRSGVTIASALDYRAGDSGYRSLLALRPLLEKLPGIPYGTVVHLLAPLLGRMPTPIDAFQVWHGNTEPAIVRWLHARCFHTVPTKLLASLATTFEERGLCDGRRRIFYFEEAGRYRIPTLLLAGSKDRQVSVEAVRLTAERLGGRAEVKVHGLAWGDAHEYGHWDLILGCTAEREVWPEILAWLREHESPALAGAPAERIPRGDEASGTTGSGPRPGAGS